MFKSISGSCSVCHVMSGSASSASMGKSRRRDPDNIPAFCLFPVAVFWELGCFNKVWGCALPSSSAGKGEGIPCSLIWIFNAPASLLPGTGSAQEQVPAERSFPYFHAWYLQAWMGGRNYLTKKKKEKKRFLLSHGRVNRNPSSVLSYCILTLWEVGG